MKLCLDEYPFRTTGVPSRRGYLPLLGKSEKLIGVRLFGFNIGETIKRLFSRLCYVWQVHA